MMEIEHITVRREHYTANGVYSSVNLNTSDHQLTAIHIGLMYLDGDTHKVEFAGGVEELEMLREQISAIIDITLE
jgi:hypothetical protein